MRQNRVFLLSILGSTICLVWMFVVPHHEGAYDLVSPVPDVMVSATIDFASVATPAAGAPDVTPPAPGGPATSR